MIRDRVSYRLAQFRRDESGTVLVEYAIVITIFLALFFALIDFGRLSFSYVMAQKATERAVREAVVRTPICAGVPTTNTRGSIDGDTEEFGFGASCNIASGLCTAAADVSCSMAANTADALAIWAQVAPLLPTNATRENLLITYAFDENLGFLGGPYTPVVTVEIQNLDFEFVTPFGALLTLSGSSTSDTNGDTFAFPSMSASLPAEVLQTGDT